MSATQNIVIAALAGVVVIGGVAYVKQDDLKTWLGGGGIHAVDFRNTPVEVIGTACADPQLTTAGVTKLPLHDGAYQLGQYQFELVGDVRYGDVSGHTGESASDKAVFVGSCSSAGKTSQVLFVYGMEDGKPERLASTDLSGTANTLVQSYAVSDGAIQIKANQGDPPQLVTLSYALLNGSLVNLNPQAAQSVAQTQTETPVENTVDTNGGTDTVSYQSFHDQLSPYGQWMQHPRWGTVWHPTQVPASFQPYRNGHWENTDEYGTVWVSDYSWGDVPFHYGRWGYDPGYGWLWQPGYTWSPAWVVWRAGAGDIGWFPMPPGYYDGSRAFYDDWGGWYGYRDLYGAALDEAAFLALWSFVPADDIYAPSVGVDLLAPGTYGSFAGRTAPWTRFGTEHGHLVNRSIDGARFRAAFGHPLPIGARHDFLAHHGPIVGIDRGRLIAAHERVHTTVGLGHGVAIGVHHTVYGGVHQGYVHHVSYPTHVYGHGTTYAHTSGSTHVYSHGAGTYGHTTTGGYSHSTGNPAYAQHPTYGNTGYAQHPVYGSSYASHPASTGGSAHPTQHVIPPNNNQRPH